MFRLLAGNRSSRYWRLDDFWCDSMSRSGDVVTLCGIPYWLSGGERCDRFQIDVALGKEPLLYSFKFTNSMTGEQLLYVGDVGWLAGERFLNAAIVHDAVGDRVNRRADVSARGAGVWHGDVVSGVQGVILS